MKIKKKRVPLGTYLVIRPLDRKQTFFKGGLNRMGSPILSHLIIMFHLPLPPPYPAPLPYSSLRGPQPRHPL